MSDREDYNSDVPEELTAEQGIKQDEELSKLQKENKASFNNHQCWDVVKNCSRFKIISVSPTVMLNGMPLHDSPARDSPLDAPMDQDSPIQREPRFIGRKAAKVKRGSTLKTACAKYLKQIAVNSALRLERNLKRDEADKARGATEREYAQKQAMEEKDMKIMAMDTSHMSPETKSYWKLKRRDVMRRKLFHDDGPNNADWLNDQNH